MIKLIAETAWHHQGDRSFMINLIEKIINETKTNYIKIHLSLNFDEYMLPDHPLYRKQKDWMLKKNDWEQIITKIKDSNKKLMILFNDKESIEFGMQFSPELVEIHSVCLNDIKLLEYLNTKITNKNKIVFGVGGSKTSELDLAINFINSNEIVLMHGFQSYPTNYEDVNLNKINFLKKMYKNYEHGYADHSSWDEPNNLLVSLIGASQGMQYLEKHVTIDMGKERVDWQSAISIDLFNQLHKKITIFNQTMGDGNIEHSDAEKKYAELGIMKKIGIAIKEVDEGEKLTLNHFNFYRTRMKTELTQSQLISKVGSKLNRKIMPGEPFQLDHF